MRKETLLDTEPMLHKTQSKESVKEWLEKTMDRLLRHGRRWMFVIGDGSTVLGLLHEDKINHEAAMDLLIRLLGLELSHALGWTSLKSVSVLADGVDTRKLQDHLSWATSALMYERARELLLDPECKKSECQQARTAIIQELQGQRQSHLDFECLSAGALIHSLKKMPCASPSKSARNNLSSRRWWKPYQCLLRIHDAGSSENSRPA